MSIFKCENLHRSDSPIYYLERDYSIPCWTDEHRSWIGGLAIPTIVFLAICFPGWSLYQIVKYKKNLDDPQLKQKYSFWYKGYRKEKFHWEFIILLRKFVIIMVTVFGSFISSVFQINCTIIVLWVSYILQIRNSPFQNPSLNRIERISLLCSASINMVGIYFALVSKKDWLDYLMIIVFAGGNVYYFYSWGREYLVVLKTKPFFKWIASRFQPKEKIWKYNPKSSD